MKLIKIYFEHMYSAQRIYNFIKVKFVFPKFEINGTEPA